MLEAWGYTVTSLDVDPKHQSTICCDIFEWNYRQFEPKKFSIITASPPCTHYSKAKPQGERNLGVANEIVQKTLEIVEYFQPDRWWLETPRHGLLPR